ncbi:hypothetical protein RB653_008088 [Dictyostelium firmibasis]|uniref:Acetyl-CoA synthetase-like protein n=1 Tax=Dictyostelium firmibasis TaxID=79012 RepID=A0AAN7TQG8_9MYCE
MFQKEIFNLSDPFNYDNDYNYAKLKPMEFWDEVAKKYVHWNKIYDKVYSGNEMYPDWFTGGKLNTCYNVLDIQAKNPLKRDQNALIYECPYLKKTIILTYYQLYEKVCEFSRVLLNLNICKDDNVLIYMPNIIESPIAMLSCARIGATHCVLFDGYSVKSLIDRIETITPKLIITSNYGILNDEIIEFTPNLIKAIELSKYKPNSVITLFRKDSIKGSGSKIIENIPTIPNTLNWEEEINKIKENKQTPYYEYVSVESSHPLYILYTSGTTGNSKAVVRSNGSHMVGIKYQNSSLLSNYQTQTTFSHTSIGWLSFHNFLYGILSFGHIFVMFEGGVVKPKHMTEDIWEIIEKHKVNYTLALAKTIRYLIKSDKDARIIHSKYNLSNLKAIWTGGEVIEESISDYIINFLKVQSLRAYGQTETGFVFFYCYNNDNYNIPHNTSGLPLPSSKPSILSENGLELGVNEIGEIAFKLPLAPGFTTTFYKNEEKFKELFKKFPGYYNPGDLGFKDKNGFYGIVSRADDQIKIGGNKIQLNAIETSILKHPLILECCSIGIYNPDCYNVPIGLLVLKQEIKNNNDLLKLKTEINSIISKDIDSLAHLRKTIIVPQLPKTKSGKIPRQIISKFLNETNYQLPDNVCDVEMFYEIKNLYIKVQ